MKVDKSNSWKEKIDPAFDDLIKVHLDYIKRTHLCSIDKRKRYLSLDDESLIVLKSKGYPPLLREFSPNLKNLKGLMNDAIITGASSDSKLISKCIEYMVILLNINEEKKSKRANKNKYADALKLNIISMIKGLPREDSRNFYKKRLGIDLSPEEAKPFVKGKAQKKIKVSIEMLKDIFCLMHQTGTKGYWGLHSESYNDKRINKLNLINTEMQQIYNAISIMTYKKSLGKLLEEARNDDKSLCKAIHIDKTLFDEDWVRERIRKAFYSGDSSFLKNLGKEIIKPPIPLKGVHEKLKEVHKLLLILVKFWPIGFCRLEIKELVGLLEASGLTIQEDIETFRKYIDRLKNANVLFDLEKLITIKKTRT